MLAATLRSLNLRKRRPFGSGRSLATLATYDIAQAFPGVPALVVQVCFGLVCTVSGMLLRGLIDQMWNGAGPFGLMVPFVLLATLFGKWQAGLLTAVLSSLFAWYFVLPIEGSWSFAVASDGPRVVVNIGAALFVVALGELFRRTMWQALGDREMLLREIEHRVKNNFASVASLLRIQMREHAGDETIMHALQAALGRVESYGLVNSFLYRGAHYTGTVDLSGYLNELCSNLERSAPHDKAIRIVTEVQPLIWTRDHTIILGLLVNELVINAYKHAFTDRSSGQVNVSLTGNDVHWRLEVADDGVGFAGISDGGSLGHKLVSSLVGQLGASVELISDEDGTRYVIDTDREGSQAS